MFAVTHVDLPAPLGVLARRARAKWEWSCKLAGRAADPRAQVEYWFGRGHIHFRVSLGAHTVGLYRLVNAGQMHAVEPWRWPSFVEGEPQRAAQ